MGSFHLSPRQILAAEEDLGARARGHLATCPECRRAVDAARWMRVLARASGGAGEPPHPRDEEVVAWHTSALAPARMREVRTHLERCEPCLTRASWLREADEGAPALPSTLAFDAALAQVADAMKRQSPGVLIVRRVADWLTLRFVPGGMADLHVAYARARPAFVSERTAFDAAEPWSDEGDELEALDAVKEEVPLTLARAAFRVSRAYFRDIPASEATVPIFGGRLLLAAIAPFRVAVLEVRWRPDEEPAGGLAGRRVRLQPAGGQEIAAETDAAGRACVPLLPGHARLIVQLDPAVELAVRFPR